MADRLERLWLPGQSLLCGELGRSRARTNTSNICGVERQNEYERREKVKNIFSILCALVLVVLLTFAACGALPEEEEEEETLPSLATIYGGQLVRMDYASDGVTVGGTFDFQLSCPGSEPDTSGFLNVVADLDLSGSISTDEWIVANIPLFLDSTMAAQPLLSVWFDPGTHDLAVDTIYDTWATVLEAQVTDPGGYASWDHSRLPATSYLWCQNDPQGQSGDAVPTSGVALAGDNVTYVKLRGGVPDIAQKMNECGPTSTANSLRWLAKEHGFENKLPANDDDLIKELMKAMAGNDTRPFGGLEGNQLLTGKTQYVAQKKLPLDVKGGNGDPDAVGAKAFDFACRQHNAGQDVEFLIDLPDPRGMHWVTVVGCGVNGNRLFLAVNDPDDGKEGTALWTLQRDGTIVDPPEMGKAAWAVAECPKPDAYIGFETWTINGQPVPPGTYEVPRSTIIDIRYKVHVDGQPGDVVTVQETSWLNIHYVSGEEPSIWLHAVNAPDAVSMDPPATKVHQMTVVEGKPAPYCTYTSLLKCVPVNLGVGTEWTPVVCTHYTKTINWLHIGQVTDEEVLFDLQALPGQNYTLYALSQVALEGDENPENDYTDWSPALNITVMEE